MAKDPEASRRKSGRLTDHVTLGVLSSVIHRDIVDDVLRECGKREQRSRLSPAHVVVYYTLAPDLYPRRNCTSGLSRHSDVGQ
ncbi:MAG: transposase domain-containing protein [Actinomycetota bacterium]|nr:transposase domain-containing protein [Actinomycetota bacterium]